MQDIALSQEREGSMAILAVVVVVLFVLVTLAFSLGVGIFLNAITRGFVLSKLWGWFMVPVFGLPGIGIVQAFGISCTISFLINRSTTDDVAKKKMVKKLFTAFSPQRRLREEKPKSEEEELSGKEKAVLAFFEVVLVPAVALLVGWILHLFM